MKLTTTQIGAHMIDIEVFNDGTFGATFDEQDFNGATLSELTTKLQKAVKNAATAKPIDVSIVNLTPRTKSDFGKNEPPSRGETPYVSGRGIVHAFIRGKSERGGAWLMTSTEGRKFKVNQWEARHQLVRRLTPDEEREYRDMATAADISRERLEQWISERLVDADELIKANK